MTLMNQLSFTNPLVDVPATYARGEGEYSVPPSQDLSDGAPSGVGQTPVSHP